MEPLEPYGIYSFRAFEHATALLALYKYHRKAQHAAEPGTPLLHLYELHCKKRRERSAFCHRFMSVIRSPEPLDPISHGQVWMPCLGMS